MRSLIRFELGTYFKKAAIYVVLLSLAALGFFIGYKLSFNPGGEIYRNAPYGVATMIGFLSLSGIFTTTVLAVQTLFKEKDAGFSKMLYATPITKWQYLVSRFAAVFGISLCCLLFPVVGYFMGQLADSDRAYYRSFNLWFYVYPLCVLAIPNLFLCSALVSCVAWLGKNRMLVYLSGLFLYIAYMVMLVYSGSPMMAGSLPQSSEAMELSAKLDPFGLSAFYQQTNAWTFEQKNSSIVRLTGNLLLNRLGYLVFAALLLLFTARKFRFSIDERARKARLPINRNGLSTSCCYQLLASNPTGLGYHLNVLKSYVSLDMRIVFKSIPFVLIAIGLVFYLSMELYQSIDRGIRLPEQYATTALMVNRIIHIVPGMLVLVVLFYSHELFWRSTTHKFDVVESSTPAERTVHFVSKWISLSIVILLLTTVAILTGIACQLLYHYREIQWEAYACLYWLVVTPLISCAGIVLGIQSMVNRKWTGLLVAAVVLFLLTTSFGKLLGITHPLFRFATAYTARYSEMNGWDNYFNAFSWKAFYGLSLTCLFTGLAANLRSRRIMRSLKVCFAILILSCLSSGLYIYDHTTAIDKDNRLDKQQAYEQHYRRFSGIAQPTVVHIQAHIGLYPKNNSYQVTGRYSMRNNSHAPVTKILVNLDEHVQFEQVSYRTAREKIVLKGKKGFIHLRRPLMPGDTAAFIFSFDYHWDGFTGHQPFNAIVNNGTFIRISNYFPRFGYQSDEEISDLAERQKRNLGEGTRLLALEAPRSAANDFVKLDMTISTEADQTAIGVGDLIGEWKAHGRHHFRYRTASPVPFRFGISSARYKVRSINHKGVRIAVYYDHRHFQNVEHLIDNAKRALDYCRTNFGPYPYKTIRFAEVSLFTSGFAGTAYPATVFMTEDMIFHNNLQGDRGQDVINELAAHELSHQWWGANQLVPDDREGAKLLTETLAMYTELMVTMHSLGLPSVEDKFAMHHTIYLNDRGFAKEEALYKVKPESIHLYYSKGYVAMYRLSELIGEDSVNKALRNLLSKHRYPNPAPVSTDLLREFYAVSKPSAHRQIDSLFKAIDSF